jgi:hypothetical protein
MGDKSILRVTSFLSFYLFFLVNQNQDLSFLADTRKYRGVAINSTRLTWALTKDIATAIK